jgi:hypothetical protein
MMMTNIILDVNFSSYFKESKGGDAHVFLNFMHKLLSDQKEDPKLKEVVDRNFKISMLKSWMGKMTEMETGKEFNL